MSDDIWDAVSFESVISNVPNRKLPKCNRGSWYCPVATKDDARTVDYLCRKQAIDRVYDLGAGTLEFATEMDSRGYDVIAYESIAALAEYAENQLPPNDVEVRTRDYYADWGEIRNNKAAFVAFGKVNAVPGDVPNGFAIDGMSATEVYL